MARLPTLQCPECGAEIESREFAGAPKTARVYSDCLRQCIPCGFGWSNSANNPKPLYREPGKRPRQTLMPLPCPDCGAILESRPFTLNARGGAPTVHGYDDCLRRCEPCGIGLSNAGDPSKVKVLRRLGRTY